MLPRMGTVNAAGEFSRKMPLTPTLGYFELAFEVLYTGSSVRPEVELISSMPSDPFLPFCGAKNAHTPLFPAGHATINLGPMMVRLSVDRGLVTTTWAST